MRILYLLFSFTVGGTERLVADICNEMTERGNDIHLYIVNDLVSEELLKSLNKDVSVLLQKRPVGKGKKLITLWEIASYVKRYRIQIIHCNALNTPELLLLSKVLNPETRIIYTVHGIGQYKTLGRKRIALRNKLCNTIIGISDAVVEDIVNAGCDKSKVIRVYNGIKTDKYNRTIKKQFNPDYIVMGCIGRIMPSIKGQDVLLHALPDIIERHPTIKVIFAGGVANSQRQEYKKMLSYVKNNELDKNVDFIGVINSVPELLSKIDICVVPSRSEGFGLAMIEAMSMGVPCIVSDVGGLREIVDNEKQGILFSSGNSEDFAIKFEQMISNYNEECETAWGKKNQIGDKYSIYRMCDELTQIYISV